MKKRNLKASICAAAAIAALIPVYAPAQDDLPSECAAPETVFSMSPRAEFADDVPQEILSQTEIVRVGGRVLIKPKNGKKFDPLTAKKIFVLALPPIAAEGANAISIDGFYDSDEDADFAEISSAIDNFNAGKAQPAENPRVAELKVKVLPPDYYCESPEQFEAIAALQKLAQEGDREAAAFLADIYSKKFLGARYEKFRDDNFAKIYARRAAELGDAEYIIEVSQTLKNSQEEFEKFAQSLAEMCGEKEAAELRLKYFRGTDRFAAPPRPPMCAFAPSPDFRSKTSVRDAKQYYSTACALASKFPASDLCAPLADCYANGIGTGKSPEKVFSTLRKVSFSPRPWERVFARLALSFCFSNGYGTKPDGKFAKIYFEAAFSSRSNCDAAAAAVSARRFFEGYGVPKDAEFSKRIISEACLAGGYSFADFRAELYPACLALFSEKNAGDIDRKTAEAVKRRAAQLERDDAAQILASLSMPADRAPVKSDFESALGRINSDRLAAAAMTVVNAYYVFEADSQKRIGILSAAVAAANAATDADFVSDARFAFKNFQDRPALILSFGDGGLKRFCAALETETKTSP